MHSLEQRLAYLARQPASVRAQVLSAALGHALGPEQRALVRVLLETGRPEALAAVVRHFHRLHPDAARLVVDFPTSLVAGIRLVEPEGGDRALRNAVELAGSRTDAAVAPFLAAVLDQKPGVLTGPASRALLEIVIGVAGLDGRRPLDPGIAATLDSALAAAARSYWRHRERRTLIAAAILSPRAGPRLKALLADAAHPVHFAMRAAIGRVGDPLVRRNILRWLTFDPLGTTAARSFGRLKRTADLGEVLEQGHLLLATDRRRMLRHHDSAPRIPDPSEAARMPESCQPALVRLVCALPLRPAVRREWFAAAHALTSPLARALAVLAEEPGRAPDVWAAMKGDGNRTVAALTLLVEQKSPAALEASERSIHPLVARRATRALAGRGAAGFLERWLHLEAIERRAAFLTLAEPHRNAVMERLAVIVRAGDRVSRLAVIGLIRGQPLTANLEDELIAAAACDDAHVASAAVTALERRPLGGPRRAALLRAMQQSPPRVRANALEVLGRLEDLADDLIGSAASGPNRLAANAALIELRRSGAPGEERLRRMLANRDAPHRVSAIWAARRSRCAGLIADLRSVASNDTLAEVRERADGAVRFLVTSTRPRGLAW